jgi:aminopeptidase YwaD
MIGLAGGAFGDSPAARVEQDRLVATLRALPTQRAALGDEAHQKGLAATEKLLLERLREMGLEPAKQPLGFRMYSADGDASPSGSGGNAGGDYTWHNIIVELPGRDLPHEILIIGAHFDAVPGSPGADDNGTGTAALLELARVLKEEPMRRTVRLVFFNLEEVGVVGSAEYVREYGSAFRSGQEKLIGMVSLEMLGYFSDEPYSQRSPFPAVPGVFEPPTVGDSIVLATVQRHQAFSRRLAREMSAAEPRLKVFAVDFFPQIRLDLLRSDHGPFLLAGLPGVILTDTAEYRNPHYHSSTDTIETLDLERYTYVVRAVAGAVHAIAEPVAVLEAGGGEGER